MGGEKTGSTRYLQQEDVQGAGIEEQWKKENRSFTPLENSDLFHEVIYGDRNKKTRLFISERKLISCFKAPRSS